MQNFVHSCKEKLGSLEGKTIVDVGCNDGSLLDYFRSGGGITIGVEPTDACLDAQEKGHEVYQTYFDIERLILLRSQMYLHILMICKACLKL